MNDRWTELTGQTTAEAAGYGFLSTIHPNDLERFKQVAGQGNHRKEGWRLLVDLQLPNGGTRRVDAAAAPLLAPDGSVLAYLCAFSPFSTALLADNPATAPSVATAESVATQAAPAVEAAPVEPQPAVVQADAPVASEVQIASEEPAVSQVQAAVEAPAAVPEAQQIHQAPQMTEAPHVPQAPQMPHYGQAPTDQAPAQAPYAVPSDVIASPPVAGDQTSGQWQPPALKEGYTDPQLLLAPKKASTEADVEAPPLEPGLDKVTGLPNRLLFAQHVASTVSRMQSDALTVSVSFIDLHGLEEPRKTIGSRATNDYMFLLAKRLEATIRSIEIAGRIDGDIVAILSINWLFADDLPVVAQRLINKLSEPLAGKDGEPISIAMSLGMAVAQPGEAVNDIFGRAWTALQKAKQSTEKHFEIDFGS